MCVCERGGGAEGECVRVSQTVSERGVSETGRDHYHPNLACFFNFLLLYNNYVKT